MALCYTDVASLVELLGGYTFIDPGRGGGDDHSTPSSFEVENGCSCTAAGHVCYNGVDRNDFAFLDAFA